MSQIINAQYINSIISSFVKQRMSVYMKQQMSTVIAEFSQQMKKKHAGITTISGQINDYINIKCETKDDGISIQSQLSQNIKNIIDQQAYNILQNNMNIITNNRADEIVDDAIYANIETLLSDEILQSLFDNAFGSD